MSYGTSATTTSGAYSIKLADGNYKITAVKQGYTMSPQSLTVSANATQNLIMTSASLAISGTITAGGSVAPSAFVWAEKVGGGFTGTQADASGNYSLSVDSGSWRVFAASEKYTKSGYASNPINVSASQSGINIALTTAANIQDNLVTSSTFKDTASGSFEDTTVNTKVSVDGGALGQAGSDSYITAKETVNYPDSSSVNVIANKAKDINAYSGGSQVKNLSTGKKATVELTYTVAELATSEIDTPAEVSQLKVSTVNEQKEWEALSTVVTYKDSSGNAVSVATTSSSIPASVSQITFTTTDATHFSPYALTEANDPSAPSQPSGVSATAATAGTASITLNWTANSSEDNVTGYYIYRDTASNPNSPLLTSTTATSYTDTGLTFGTTYYYRVAAYRNTLESQASSEVSATPSIAAGGGIISSGGGGGGGGSAPSIPSQTPSPSPSPAIPATPAVPGVSPAVPATPSLSAQPSATALSVSPVFNRSLYIGVINSDVKRLQQLLNLDKDTMVSNSGVGSKGNETNYFGPATEKAVRKFQEKHNIAKQGETGYGVFGPKTQVKMQEIVNSLSGTLPPETPSVPSIVSRLTPASVSPIFTKGLEKGMRSEDIKRLQQLLNLDQDTMVSNSGAGSKGNETNYFGPATERAVRKFQEKHNLAKQGDAGYGFVGPKTRDKLAEIHSGIQTELPSSLSSNNDLSLKEQLQRQIQQLLKQVELLQSQLGGI